VQIFSNIKKITLIVTLGQTHWSPNWNFS